MLLGCCHCGEEQSESVPPSESTPSASESVLPSESDSGADYSVIGSSCIAAFGCAAIPRRLSWNISVSGGSWDGDIDCICPPYNGTFTLKFCECNFTSLLGYRLFYATDDLGWWRGRPGFGNNDLQGCRSKAAGSCVPVEGGLSSTRLYYAVVTPVNIRVFTTTYRSADMFGFTNLTQEWTFTGSPNCLASASYTLPRTSAYTPGFDGCGWAESGTLSPG